MAAVDSRYKHRVTFTDYHHARLTLPYTVADCESAAVCGDIFDVLHVDYVPNLVLTRQGPLESID